MRKVPNLFWFLRLRFVEFLNLGSFSKPRRQRLRESGKTKGLMSRTMALHVHYKPLYISQPSSAKQQREITTFCVFNTTRVPTANFSCFYWEMKPAFTYSAYDKFDAVRQTEYIQPFAKFVSKIQVQFLIDVFLGVTVVVSYAPFWNQVYKICFFFNFRSKCNNTRRGNSTKFDCFATQGSWPEL